MPSCLLYLGLMLGVICIWFMLLKRPVYEAVLVSFLLLLTITGNWGNIWTYIDNSLSTSLLYSMVAFVAMSIILTKTKIIDSCIAACLLAGGLSFVGFLVALIIGGNAATAICLFLKETYLPIVIYCSSVAILLGLLAMYLTREKALTVDKEKKRK